MFNALLEKYTDSSQKPSTGSEWVTLGSSKGTIQVEAVGLDKIRTKLSKLDQLRVVGLDECNIVAAGPTDTLRDTIPGGVLMKDTSFALLISDSRGISGSLTQSHFKLDCRERNRDSAAQVTDVVTKVCSIHISIPNYQLTLLCSGCRLSPLDKGLPPSPYATLQELQLNNTLTHWEFVGQCPDSADTR